MRSQFDLKSETLVRYARASFLSILYLVALILIWDSVSGWLVQMLQAGPKYSNISPVLQSLGIEFVSLNALGFGGVALWLARTRDFKPLAAYAVPLLIALWLTLPIGLIAAYALAWLAFVLRAAGNQAAWFMTYLPSLIPGILVAQLLRFQRRSRSSPASDSTVQAV
jgi:hypothetical protein